MVERPGRDEPVYVISVAAKMLNMHPQTLRYYERVGLINPSRTRGRIRLYSERDIERLRRITRMVGELGVNLAGAEIILRMTRQMEELQREMERIQAEFQGEIERLHRRLEG